jgi:hypothetical protein
MNKEDLIRLNPQFESSINSATDEELRLANDPDYARQNPGKFVNNRWAPTKDTNPIEDLLWSAKEKASPYFSAAGDFLGKHRDNAVRTTYGNALGYGAGAGALGGLTIALLRGSDSPLRDALIGAGLGAGLGLYARRSNENIGKNIANMHKQSSFSDLSFIQQKIMSEPGLDSNTKDRMIRQVRSLPESQISEISRLLKTAFGASVGAILSRFLGGGFWGALGGAILGGVVGYKSHDPFIVDAYGRKKLLNFM